MTSHPSARNYLGVEGLGLVRCQVLEGRRGQLGPARPGGPLLVRRACLPRGWGLDPRDARAVLRSLEGLLRGHPEHVRRPAAHHRERGAPGSPQQVGIDALGGVRGRDSLGVEAAVQLEVVGGVVQQRARGGGE